MILILQSKLEKQKYYVLEFQDTDTSQARLDRETLEKIFWLFQAGQIFLRQGPFIGPRREMVTPWSTNVVEILKNTGITGILRAEEFLLFGDSSPVVDHMLQEIYPELDEVITNVY